MKFKEYTKKEVEDFCEDNFIEPDDEKKIWNFIKKFTRVNLTMKSGKQRKDDLSYEGILTISIGEGDP